jgi:hypothetical protein
MLPCFMELIGEFRQRLDVLRVDPWRTLKLLWFHRSLCDSLKRCSRQPVRETGVRPVELVSCPSGS